MDDREYKPRALPGVLAQAHASAEAGFPPPGAERIYILAKEGSAVSAPEQLQGILCMRSAPGYEQATTIPEPRTDEEAQHVRIFCLQYRDFKVLTERAEVKDGPKINLAVGMESRDTLKVSKVVWALKPSAYPPRSLDHHQTCIAKTCHLSSPVRLESSKMASLSIEASDGSPQPTPVLHTPELLELVLYHLDFRTRIVSAPRVCKLWSDTLNASPLLQRVSFFRPEKLHASGEEPRLNPLLVEAFGDTFFHAGPERPPARRAECFWKLPWSPQALLKMKAPAGSILIVEPTCHQKAFMRAGASWRKMLVSQPPPPFLGFMWLDDHPHEPRRRLRMDSINPFGKTSSPLGVTMGQLYDTVQHFVMQQPYPGLFFRVRWDMVCQREVATRRNAGDDPENSGSSMERTNLVVDFFDDQYYVSSMLCGPFNMKATRTVFRCEEATLPVFGRKGTIEDLDVEAFMDNSADPLEFWQPLYGAEYTE